MKLRASVLLLTVLICTVGSATPQARAADPSSKAPLTLEWSGVPILSVNVVKGSVVVANQADDDFEQTVIVEAVNEMGKAFALGYQHFNLRSHSRSVPISFETKLPPGHYVIHADAVAEVPTKHAIYRQHIEGLAAFQISVI